MMNLLLIGAGGALGAISRYLTGQAAARLFGMDQPWGTFIVNIAGGLAMGVLIGWLSLSERADENAIRLFAATGFLGGFTTFSAYSLELALMIERKAWLNALLYAAGSVVLALLAVMAGLILIRRVMA